MLRFHAADFVAIMDGLRKIADVLHRDGGDTADQRIRELAWTLTDATRQSADRVGLTSSVMAAEKMLRAIETNRRPSRMSELFRELETVVQYELRDRMVFVVPQARAQYYDAKEPLDGSDIVNKLPKTLYDATEAGKCFAVGRYTACVFHLMRVVEACVQALGVKLGAQIENGDNWQSILDKTRRAVNDTYSKHSSPERIAYDEVLAYLTSVKNAWRNPTMHPATTYTEEDVRGIMPAVSGFTKSLAAML